MAHQLTGKTIASTFEQLIYRSTTEPSTGTTTTQLMTSENDQTDDVGLPLYISTERVGIGTSTPDYTLDVEAATSTGRINSTGNNNAGLILKNTSCEWFNYIAPTSGNWKLKDTTSNLTPITIEKDSADNMLYFKADGNVGIGETSPEDKLHITSTAGNLLKLERTSSTRNVNIEMKNDTGTMYMGLDEGNFIVSHDSTKNDKPSFVVKSVTSNHSDGGAHVGGDIGINTISPTANLHVMGECSNTNPGIRVEDTEQTSSDGKCLMILDFSNDSNVYGAGGSQISTFLAFHDSDGEIGAVNAGSDGASVAYSTTSDYRLKEDLKDVSDAMGTINKLKIYDFKWKKSGVRGVGVLAHETQEVIPTVVSGDKDRTNEDGSFRAQGVDYSRIVPYLIKAVQELSAKVTALESA